MSSDPYDTNNNNSSGDIHATSTRNDQNSYGGLQFPWRALRTAASAGNVAGLAGDTSAAAAANLGSFPPRTAIPRAQSASNLRYQGPSHVDPGSSYDNYFGNDDDGEEGENVFDRTMRGNNYRSLGGGGGSGGAAGGGGGGGPGDSTTASGGDGLLPTTPVRGSNPLNIWKHEAGVLRQIFGYNSTSDASEGRRRVVPVPTTTTTTTSSSGAAATSAAGASASGALVSGGGISRGRAMGGEGGFTSGGGNDSMNDPSFHLMSRTNSHQPLHPLQTLYTFDGVADSAASFDASATANAADSPSAIREEAPRKDEELLEELDHAASHANHRNSALEAAAVGSGEEGDQVQQQQQLQEYTEGAGDVDRGETKGKWNSLSLEHSSASDDDGGAAFPFSGNADKSHDDNSDNNNNNNNNGSSDPLLSLQGNEEGGFVKVGLAGSRGAFRTRNMNALHAFSWDQRTFLPQSYGRFAGFFQLIASPRFLEKMDWALRGSMLTIVPVMILCLEENTQHIFPLASSAVAFAYWTTQPTFGAGLRELFIVVKGFSVSLMLVCVLLAMRPESKAFVLVFLFVTLVTITFLAEQMRRTCAYCLASMCMQYITKPDQTTYMYVVHYFTTLIIALSFGLVAFLMPYIRWSSDIASHYMEVLGDSMSLSLRGLCQCFWVRSPTERQLNMLRLRQLHATTTVCLQKVSTAISESGYEPHSGAYIAQLKSRKSFFENLFNVAQSMTLLMERIAGDPQLVETPLCRAMGREMRREVAAIGDAMDTVLLHICRLDEAPYINNEATNERFAAFRTAVRRFEDKLVVARGRFILNNPDYVPSQSDVLLGFFFFSIEELCEYISRFTEKEKPRNNIYYFLTFAFRDFGSTISACKTLYRSVRHRHTITRRLKEALKLSLAMIIAAIFQTYILTAERTSAITGADLIAFMYRSTGAESFTYASNRLLGTVLGSLTGLMSVQIANGRRWALYLLTFVLTSAGGYVQTSPTASALGSAINTSVISIVVQYQNQAAAMVRIQQNCFAIFMYFGITSVLWPIRGRQKMRLGLDLSLRMCRESACRMLSHLDVGHGIAHAVQGDVLELLDEMSSRIDVQRSNMAGAATEPTLDSADFPQMPWERIIEIQQKMLVLLFMMRHAYFSFMSSKVQGSAGDAAPADFSVHWVLLRRLTPHARELSALIHAALDIYIVALVRSSFVPTAHLARIRNGMLQCYQRILHTFLATMQREEGGAAAAATATASLASRQSISHADVGGAADGTHDPNSAAADGSRGGGGGEGEGPASSATVSEYQVDTPSRPGGSPAAHQLPNNNSFGNGFLTYKLSDEEKQYLRTMIGNESFILHRHNNNAHNNPNVINSNAAGTGANTTFIRNSSIIVSNKSFLNPTEMLETRKITQELLMKEREEQKRQKKRQAKNNRKKKPHPQPSKASEMSDKGSSESPHRRRREGSVISTDTDGYHTDRTSGSRHHQQQQQQQRRPCRHAAVKAQQAEEEEELLEVVSGSEKDDDGAEAADQRDQTAARGKSAGGDGGSGSAAAAPAALPRRHIGSSPPPPPLCNTSIVLNRSFFPPSGSLRPPALMTVTAATDHSSSGVASPLAGTLRRGAEPAAAAAHHLENFSFVVSRGGAAPLMGFSPPTELTTRGGVGFTESGPAGAGGSGYANKDDYDDDDGDRPADLFDAAGSSKRLGKASPALLSRSGSPRPPRAPSLGASPPDPLERASSSLLQQRPLPLTGDGRDAEGAGDGLNVASSASSSRGNLGGEPLAAAGSVVFPASPKLDQKLKQSFFNMMAKIRKGPGGDGGNVNSSFVESGGTSPLRHTTTGFVSSYADEESEEEAEEESERDERRSGDAGGGQRRRRRSSGMGGYSSSGTHHIDVEDRFPRDHDDDGGGGYTPPLFGEGPGGGDDEFISNCMTLNFNQFKEYLEGAYSLSNKDVHSIEAFLFGLQSLIHQVGKLEKALLEIIYSSETARKL